METSLSTFLLCHNIFNFGETLNAYKYESSKVFVLTDPLVFCSLSDYFLIKFNKEINIEERRDEVF